MNHEQSTLVSYINSSKCQMVQGVGVAEVKEKFCVNS
jgi:hypothetical protein